MRGLATLLIYTYIVGQSHLTSSTVLTHNSIQLHPLTSIGIFADVQYADQDDGWNYRKTTQRKYRKTATCLKDLIQTFDNYNNLDIQKLLNQNSLPEKLAIQHDIPSYIAADRSVNSTSRIETVLNLGDLIDGACGRTEKPFKNSHESIEMLLNVTENAKSFSHVLHSNGNHEHYNFKRSELYDYFHKQHVTSSHPDSTQDPHFFKILPDTLAFSTAVRSNPRIKILHFDTYDISLGGRHKNHEKWKLADQILTENNPNYQKDKTRGNDPTGLIGNGFRFVAYTGGVSERQLDFIREELARFDSDPETDLVILMSHCNIHPKALSQKTAWTNTIWNFEQVLKIIDQNNSNNKIFCHLAGHAHRGGYYFDRGLPKSDLISADKFYLNNALGNEGVDDLENYVDSDFPVPRNIHHIVMGGIIEKADTNHYAIMEFYENFAILRGFGDCKTRFLKYAKGVSLKNSN